MTTVYVVLGQWDYEGAELIATFAVEQTADHVADCLNQTVTHLSDFEYIVVPEVLH